MSSATAREDSRHGTCPCPGGSRRLLLGRGRIEVLLLGPAEHIVRFFYLCFIVILGGLVASGGTSGTEIDAVVAVDMVTNLVEHSIETFALPLL